MHSHTPDCSRSNSFTFDKHYETKDIMRSWRKHKIGKLGFTCTNAHRACARTRTHRHARICISAKASKCRLPRSCAFKHSRAPVCRCAQVHVRKHSHACTHACTLVQQMQSTEIHQRARPVAERWAWCAWCHRASRFHRCTSCASERKNKEESIQCQL